MSIENKIVYFEQAGRVNTEETLRLAKERGEELGIRHFVIASTLGPTAIQALEIFEDADVTFTFVGHVSRNFPKNVQRELEAKGEPKDFPPELRRELEAKGHSVAFLGEVNPRIPLGVQNAYRRLAEGFKVVTECVAIAVDAGLVPEGEEVIAIGGTGRWSFPEGGGADTAIVMEAMGGADYRERYESSKKAVWRKIHEIICKPR